MKYLSSLLIGLLLSSTALAQNTAKQEVSTKIKAVRVFTEQAEITREVSVSLSQGKNELTFTNLSPEIDPSSIRLDGKGFTILSVKQQYNVIDLNDPEATRQPLVEKQEELTLNIQNENKKLADLKKAKEILLANQSIKGNSNLTVAELRAAMDFFQERLSKITDSVIAQEDKIRKLQEEQQLTEGKINALGVKETKQYGQVIALLETKQASKVNLTLKYAVGNARWLPSYDIRFNSVDAPLFVNYKANVQQSTGIDWKNVDLSISSGNPEEGGQSPQLTPWRLDFYSKYQVPLNSRISQVSGYVFDENRKPLAGTVVMVEGTTIGTVTDTQGRYSISIPSNASSLSFNYLGYSSKTIRITSEELNVALYPVELAIEDDEDIVYKNRALTESARGEVRGIGSMAGAERKPGSVQRAYPQQQKSEALEVFEQEYQTNFAYDIKTPYDIPSDNQSYAVEMVRHEMPASFNYTSTPKLLDKAFLNAQILNWGKYNLLEGEANLFVENSFVGKTVLELNESSDTLNLSLGRDERIIVKREKDESFLEKKFIGTKRKETVAWKISLRNTKKEAVNLVISDQIPVPVNEDIKVEAEELSGASYDSKTGLLTWRLSLPANSTKDIVFRYTVTYPKVGAVYLE